MRWQYRINLVLYCRRYQSLSLVRLYSRRVSPRFTRTRSAMRIIFYFRVTDARDTMAFFHCFGRENTEKKYFTRQNRLFRIIIALARNSPGALCACVHRFVQLFSKFSRITSARICAIYCKRHKEQTLLCLVKEFRGSFGPPHTSRSLLNNHEMSLRCTSNRMRSKKQQQHQLRRSGCLRRSGDLIYNKR